MWVARPKRPEGTQGPSQLEVRARRSPNATRYNHLRLTLSKIYISDVTRFSRNQHQLITFFFFFFLNPGIPGVKSIGRMSLNYVFVDIIDMAEEYTNSIPTDEAKRTIPDNVTMQVTAPGGQMCNQ